LGALDLSDLLLRDIHLVHVRGRLQCAGVQVGEVADHGNAVVGVLCSEEERERRRMGEVSRWRSLVVPLLCLSVSLCLSLSLSLSLTLPEGSRKEEHTAHVAWHKSEERYRDTDTQRWR
jgi:hypothetical protein